MTESLFLWTLLAQAPAAEAAAAQPAANNAPGVSGWLVFLFVVGIFVVPFALGSLFARMLRLRDLSVKIGISLFALFLGLAPFAVVMWRGGTWTDALRPGIDLAGGTNLVFQVQFDQVDKEFTDTQSKTAAMTQMVNAVARRLDPAAQEQITVRRVGADRIEVIIPGADPDVVARKKNMMTRLGSLEFAIVANDRDHRALIREAQGVTRDLRQGGRVVAGWRPIAVDDQGNPKVAGIGEDDGVREVERDGKKVTEVLVLIAPENERLTGKYLSRSYPTTDDLGAPAVGFTFVQRGGYIMQQLTSQNQPRADGSQRKLAILLDGAIQSAPGLESVISDSGIIRGNFTMPEVEELVGVLNAGALEVPIDPNPVSEATISPLLGKDVQEKGLRAIFISGAAVFIFMLVYYLVAGVVADISLVLNLVMLLGVMSLIEASLTLPGLAGIVLTIGMAVDANVLIFERMREELKRGSSLRLAIHNGFDKALSAIIDSNVTTLITAVVLYLIGTDQIRGFAVTLFIGLVISMFTAIYVGRLIFDILERKRWITSLKMLSVIGVPNWDFLSKRWIAITFSTLFIVVGMAMMVARGKENFDIDFTGGTMVTFEFTEPQSIDEVRSTLVQEFGTAITVEELTLRNDKESQEGTRFRLRTSDQDVNQVREKVNKSLGGSGHPLKRVTMQFTEVAKIESPADAAKPEGEAQTPAATDDASNSFAGGSRSELSFQNNAGEPAEISVSTAEDYLAFALTALTNADGTPRYADPAALIRVTGTEGSGMTAARDAVQRFSKMQLEVSSQIPSEDVQAALSSVQQTMGSTPIFAEVNTFDSSVAGELQQQAIIALGGSMIAIIAYLWFRFEKVPYGLAAVIACIHDILFVAATLPMAAYLSLTPVGQALGLEDFKINLTMIAAFMTILGYSLNDTIVIFDRIREVRGKNPAITDAMVNLSLNQTLARTILTSFTVLLVVVILYIFGGEGIHGFAYSLVVGTIVGSYSTIFIACPVMMWFMKKLESGSIVTSPAPQATVRA